MTKTLDYRHVAHLIAGFGSAESYVIVRLTSGKP